MPTRKTLILGVVWVMLLGSIVSGCHASERAAEHDYQEGLKQKERRNFLQASQQFRSALMNNPQHPQAHLELGILLCRDSDYRQAVKHFLRAIEFGGSSYKPYALMGYAYERLRKPKFSEQSYKRAIHRGVRLIDVRLRLADVLEQQGKRQEASEVLSDVLTLKPEIEHAEVLSSRIAFLQQPETPDVHYAMADVYIRHGQIAKGVAEYHKAEPFERNNPDSMAKFGLFCLERAQFSPAVTYLQHAKNLGQTDRLEVLAGLGIAYENLGKLPKAIQEYQAALSLQPDWYELHLKLAELFEQVGKLPEAADELEQVFHLTLRAKTTHFTKEFPDTNQLWKEILRLRGERLRKAVVQLKRSGDFRLVDVVVNQGVPVTLLVEKRAQYTILSEPLAQQLGMQITPRTSEVRFEFAGRSYTAPVVNLPSLKIGELEVRNIPILIWDLSSYSEIDGVLGMSFLKHFQVEIKHDEQLLILTK